MTLLSLEPLLPELSPGTDIWLWRESPPGEQFVEDATVIVFSAWTSCRSTYGVVAQLKKVSVIVERGRGRQEWEAG